MSWIFISFHPKSALERSFEGGYACQWNSWYSLLCYFALILIYKSNATPQIFQENGNMQLWIWGCVLEKSVHCLVTIQWIQCLLQRKNCFLCTEIKIPNNSVLFETNVKGKNLWWLDKLKFLTAMRCKFHLSNNEAHLKSIDLQFHIRSVLLNWCEHCFWQPEGAKQFSYLTVMCLQIQCSLGVTTQRDRDSERDWIIHGQRYGESNTHWHPVSDATFFHH